MPVSGPGGNSDGGIFVPDYANMETINRISTNHGTWVVDRDGFIRAGGSTSANGRVYVSIDGQPTDTRNLIGYSATAILPVKAGQTVSIEVDQGVFVAAYCYFIPPVTVIVPTATEMAWVPDYANVESTNRITSNGGTWTSDRDGFVIAILFGSATANGQNANHTFSIDGNTVFSDVIPNAATGAGITTTRLMVVKKGQTVKLEHAGTVPYAAISCRFVPPVAVLPPTVDTSAFLTVHAATDETDAVTNSSTNSGLWWW